MQAVFARIRLAKKNRKPIAPNRTDFLAFRRFLRSKLPPARRCLCSRSFVGLSLFIGQILGDVRRLRRLRLLLTQPNLCLLQTHPIRVANLYDAFIVILAAWVLTVTAKRNVEILSFGGKGGGA
ncbi:MAG: hypothetical protein RMM53_05795 [Bacteroidia bacterium]|nr:hypothetical protein [Bacteroidia bacterium]